VVGIVLSIIHPAFFLFPVVVSLITNSTWTLFCAGVGLWIRAKSKLVKLISLIVLIGAVAMCIKTGKIHAGLSQHSGRLIVWEKSIQILNERPLQGWGPGSYKYIFPALSEMTSIPWRTAHNDWIQIAFELGYILFAFIVIGWGWVLVRAVRVKQWAFLAGFLVISLDMMVHFPVRMIQCVPLIIAFIAHYNIPLSRKIV